LVLLLAASHARAQAQPQSKASILPRTPDGRPDLQGTWSTTTMTPLERPAEFAGKATVTDEEARAYEKKDHSNDPDDPNVPPTEAAFNKSQKAVGAYNSDFWVEGHELARVNGVKRTSLIVDPPDGKLPIRTPAGKRRKEAFFETFNRYDSAKDRAPTERCLPDSEVPIFPFGINDNYQIVQTPDTVMIMSEMVHDARIVRINGKHLPSDIRQWLGDSIGHWEADTLVVDTTNFKDQLGSGATSDNLHVIERFSRTGPNTLLYRATIDDPEIFTKPWTVEFPFNESSESIFEYACHEGNYSLSVILSGSGK
jgi:hypothetical protein